MSTEEVLFEAESNMEEAIEGLRHEMSKIRTGRAHSGMLDHVQVDYYGALTPLRSLANISVTEGRTLVVQPFDKSSLKAIEMGISANSGLNVPVQSDGTYLRLTLPDLTTESRKHYCKEMRKRGEEGKIRIRTVRRHANEQAKKLEKKKEITEDDEKRCHEEVQKLTDQFCHKVDEIMENKEKDIMEI
jgi:ribosome recycling factor